MSEDAPPESSAPGFGASTPRLFIDVLLSDGAQIVLPAPASHYLGQVMRLGDGDAVRLFDDRTGEWLGRIDGGGRKALGVRIERRLSVREAVPDLWLCVAPLKRGRIDWVVEKACELGVARLVPVLTRRTVVDKLNLDRLRAHMIEAAEQCGRTALPVLTDPVALAALLSGWPTERALIFADETGGAPLLEVARASPAPCAILIGPEGGFTPDERAAIRALSPARAVSLGPRILRADTAAAVAIGVWMAVAEDS